MSPTPMGLPAHLPVPSSILRRPVIVWTVAGLLAALSLMAQFAESWLRVVDDPVSSWLRGSTTGFIGELSRFGSANVALAISALAVALLWRRCRALAMVVPAAVVVETLATNALKLLIGRERPPSPLVSTTLPSFPSGHVVRAIVVLGLLIPVAYVITKRDAAFWAAVALFTIGVPATAYSRIHIGAHWFSDVVGSALLGSLVLLGVERVLRTAAATSNCTAAEARPPPPSGSLP